LIKIRKPQGRVETNKEIKRGMIEKDEELRKKMKQRKLELT
jgi:hypothetical protein